MRRRERDRLVLLPPAWEIEFFLFLLLEKLESKGEKKKRDDDRRRNVQEVTAVYVNAFVAVRRERE